MATLMQWGNSEGIKGRCDDKCHAAKEPDCQCMCGGRFHGAHNRSGGLEAAKREYLDEVVETAKARAKAEGMDLQFVEQHLRQLGLF